MHFFGLIGSLFFFIGAGFAIWLVIYKLFIDTHSRLLADRAEFYLALTFIILGTQLFLAGFIAELIGRNSTTRNNYLIEKEI
jgi:hypothetical protein